MKLLLLFPSLSLLLVACEPSSTVLDEHLTSSTQSIVNGEATSDFAAVGALVANGELLCTATLVDCDTVITAAHCICDGFNPDDCQDAQSFEFFLPNAGTFRVASAETHPGQAGFINDVAVMHLEQPIGGIRPMQLVEDEPAIGTSGTIVGYGLEKKSRFANRAYKQVGSAVSAACDLRFFEGAFEGWEETAICWMSSQENSGTCNGDSGGPMLVEANGSIRIAGTASGALNLSSTDNCREGSQVVQSSVAKASSFLESRVSYDANRCSALAEVGEQGVKTETATELVRKFTNFDLAFETDETTTRLVAAGSAPNSVEFSLVKLDEQTGEETVLCQEAPGLMRSCVVDHPEPGTYIVRGAPHFTGGPMQLSWTTFSEALDEGGDGEDCLKCDDINTESAGGCSSAASSSTGVGFFLLLACIGWMKRRSLREER